jgi:hypothetical protein
MVTIFDTMSGFLFLKVRPDKIYAMSKQPQ